MSVVAVLRRTSRRYGYIRDTFGQSTRGNAGAPQAGAGAATASNVGPTSKPGGALKAFIGLGLVGGAAAGVWYLQQQWQQQQQQQQQQQLDTQVSRAEDTACLAECEAAIRRSELLASTEADELVAEEAVIKREEQELAGKKAAFAEQEAAKSEPTSDQEGMEQEPLGCQLEEELLAATQTLLREEAIQGEADFLAAAEATVGTRINDGREEALVQQLVDGKMGDEASLEEANASHQQLISRFAEATPREFQRLSNPEQAATIEIAASREKTDEELQARIVELAGALASARLFAKANIEEELRKRLEAVESANLEKLDEALHSLNATREAAQKDADADLEHSLLQRHEETLAAATTELIEQRRVKLISETDALKASFAQEAATAHGDHLNHVVSCGVGVNAIDAILGEDAEVVTRAHAYNNLSVAMLSLEDAIVTGQNAAHELVALRKTAAEADPFAHQVLSQLPLGCVDLCERGSVPTEPLLRHRFMSKLGELSATAFLPDQRDGLLGQVMARFVFRPLYSLDAPIGRVSDSSCPPERNLAALARAKGLVERGDVDAALNDMEASLTGRVRAAAVPWMTEARDALLLRKALLTVKARVQCLNASFA